jgi:hypothetical protein
MNFFTIAAFNARRAVMRRKTLVLAILAAAPPAFVVVVRRFAPPRALDPFFESIPLFYLTFLCQILPLFFAASAVRDAVEDRTASFLLTTPTSRASFVFGAWIGMLPPLLVLTAASAACTFAAWRAGTGPLFGAEDAAACGRLILVSSYGVFVYTGLFTWLGLVVKWPTVVGILYYGVAELFLGFIPGSARRLALSSCFEALLGPPFRTRADLMAEAQAGLDVPLSPTTALYAPLITAAIVAILLARRARTRDFVDEAPTPR